ncbi:MAG: hypothetical protein K2Q03_00420 [Sphingobacteriaceae bacterium]|nr:hypothetical protein [Sphingobacteriaceae bacterium]
MNLYLCSFLHKLRRIRLLVGDNTNKGEKPRMGRNAINNVMELDNEIV